MPAAERASRSATAASEADGLEAILGFFIIANPPKKLVALIAVFLVRCSSAPSRGRPTKIPGRCAGRG